MASRVTSSINCSGDCFGSKGFTLCINHEGDVYSFGSYKDGGHGHPDLFVSPTKIPSLKHIKSISVRGQISICLDSEGNVYTFKSNEYGHLGVGVNGSSLKSTYIPQKVNLPPCIQVSCGYTFAI